MHCLNSLNQTILYVEASEHLPQTCMPDSVKRLLEVFELSCRTDRASVVGASL